MTSPSIDRLKQRCRGISAGIYAAPLGALGSSVRDLADWGGTIVHFDVMDGVFVPLMTAGADFVAALGAGLVRDVHLMVADPAAHVAAFARAGADIITVHAEAECAQQALAAIRVESGRLGRPILAGLAVMPGTPSEDIVPLLTPAPDLILVLALDPRDGKPADLVAATARLEALRQITATAQPVMAIDGGITERTIAAAVSGVPDLIVSGSAIFRAPDPKSAFGRLAAAARAPELEGESA